MAVKKSVLFSKIWDSCNTLRSKGGMDATQYKDYVLIVLFMKVITDKYYGKKRALVEVPEDANFNTMISLKGKRNIGEEFNKILAKIAEENDLQNIIDVVDFNDENKLGKGKDLVDTLTGLVDVFQDPELDFSNNRADDDDVLGDAYEFLMKKFATEAGKSKGQFYTPSEVSRIMAKILGISKNTKSPLYVYDMACGSGSLLIKAGAEAKEGTSVYLYGQEKDTNTAGLCVMNMFLHENATATIRDGNTLTNPRFVENGQVKTFDYCVANPPFSVKKWGSDLENEKEYGRFSGFGMPPANCGDYAFLLHMLKSMDPNKGRGAIILPHGVLFRGGQEEIIRTNLIKSGVIEGIIGLPANLFYGTGIPACIIVMDKENAMNRDSIFVIDASKGFVKDGNKNRLREQDIKKIVDTYTSRKEEEKYSKIVPIFRINEEGFNLNIPRYVDSTPEEIGEDLVAHVLGGLPHDEIEYYNKYWNVAPKLKNELFKETDRKGYYKLKIEEDVLSKTIHNSAELQSYKKEMTNSLNAWENKIKSDLESINSNTRVKNLIEKISDGLLERYNESKLLDKYDVYELLMEYYNNIMKDDFHMITDNGWIPTITYNKDKKGREKKDDFYSDLLDTDIVLERYFQNDKERREQLKEELEAIDREFDSTIEENTASEDTENNDLLFEADEKVNEASLKKKKKEAENSEQVKVIDELLANLEKQKKTKDELKEITKKINAELIKKYNELNENTSKDLIINDKWLKTISNSFDALLNGTVNKLSLGVEQLNRKYKNTYTDIDSEIDKVESELSNQIADLDGDEFVLDAFKELISQLK